MVWRAVHERHDESVAIKIMLGKQVRKERFVDSFHREVRAVARMNHPNIVRVFDYGELSGDRDAFSAQELVVGSPYIVMELANSTLADIERRSLEWPHIHVILAHILDALAHAHARELIHRDLKPENVLFVSRKGDTEIKISDFGVAYAIDASEESGSGFEMPTGTPRYMAPEQIQGQLREQGPWTDLYALGCLVYWLCTGAPPFTHERNAAVLRAHLTEAIPPLEPTVEVPEGFEEWALGLLSRDPSHRFRRAADAACALAEIAGDVPRSGVRFTARKDGGEFEDWTVSEDSTMTQILDHAWISAPMNSGEEPENAETIDDSLPDLPKSWRTDYRVPDALENLGVGLGLFALREIPLVGRQEHRDLLWQNLVDTRYTRRPHVVVLEGPAGIGKTRLATWLGHRAHEVGAVEVLTAHHSPISGPAEDLRRMFANHLRCNGLSRPEVVERVQQFYRGHNRLGIDVEHQCLALSHLLAPGATAEHEVDEQTIQFGRPEERYVVWKRLLNHMGRRRPVMLVLDDAHWGSNALRFIRFLLDESTQTDLPVFVVLTLRRDLMEVDSQTERHLNSIVDRPCADELRVGPLRGDDHRELIENLLHLEPQVAEKVSQRTEGNPLFAIQLVGDWVDRGLLRVGEKGFCLTDGRQPPLPDDIQAVLIQRIEEIAGHPIDEPAQSVLLSLELAAVLGHDVDEREWRLLCDQRGIRPPHGLLDLLAGHSLVRLGLQGWSFTHGALRETLLEVAAEQGRLREHHRHCAQMLQKRYDTSLDNFAPRLARHLLEARELEEALEALARGLRHYVKTCDFDAAEGFFDLHEQACRTLDIGPGDPRVIRARLEIVRMHGRRRQFDKSEQLLDACKSHIDVESHPDVLAELLLLCAKNENIRSQYDEASQFAERAQALFEGVGDEEGFGYSLLERGWARFRQGQRKGARQLLEGARRCFEDLDNQAGLGRCLYSLGLVNWKAGRTRRALELLQAAKEVHEELGDRLGVSHCLNGLGEVCRQRQDLEQAEKVYRQAIEINTQIGVDKSSAVLHLNLGMTRLQQGAYDEALPCVTKALQLEQETSKRPPYIGGALACLAACMAGRRDWERYDGFLDHARQLLEEGFFTEHEMALGFDIAAVQAHHFGEADRARRAYRMALRQWRGLGEAERVEKIKSRLQSLAETFGEPS